MLYLYNCGALLVLLSSVFFFFKAEDGIRDLVRSRGLGDVYKRQPEHADDATLAAVELHGRAQPATLAQPDADRRTRPVSYTHLTLPTSDLV